MWPEMGSQRRGRPREFEWVEFRELGENYTPEAQFLKLASVNNQLIASLAVSGCPQCTGKNFRLRHDRKHDNIRFYCPECKYETSFHIKKPPKNELQIIPVYDKQGKLIGEKAVDRFHEPTKRERVDAAVLRTEQKSQLGGEWFDGSSGTNTQNRYLTLEEAIERIAIRKMKAQMEAMLNEIEEEEKDYRLASFEADVSSS
jgi:predicted  nucleic acid-binding Zn-ribbon protein